MARAIRQALRENEGDVLAFLPGVAEIERTAARVGDMPGIALHRLHGSLSPPEQRAALRSGSTRTLVLATAIADTRLTTVRVRVVGDSTLDPRPTYHRGSTTQRTA